MIFLGKKGERIDWPALEVHFLKRLGRPFKRNEQPDPRELYLLGFETAASSPEIIRMHRGYVLTESVDRSHGRV